ncbi:prolipoprotein diacylglyceryl transferase [Pedomonas mirosovicensis]|uniref:prolipoprotein diacylglyceryl transferase n=1 Tax=Pedomonas mirosovicensis TaxID=2908641 RepID=UPI00216A4831|nr:prolipoprotein diacylglyceryl transferase [Pedomonas mirosovicensis]MCH8685967.1 prolipoprotein diacylglyceryl transferase [Pedomonas mirosovicensis]
MELGNIDPVAFEIGPLVVRWYALAYIAGILGGWWLATRMADKPGSPWTRRHIDDFITWVTLGIIIGGRLAYVIFYNLPYYIENPGAIIRLWDGGMSFHGGVIGVGVAILWFCKKYKLNWLRVADYVACVVPIGLGLGRIANFINGELWGRVTTSPVGIIFHTGGPLPRHPSQLYEAFLEGLVLLAILLVLFYRTNARLMPGRLSGAFLLFYGIFRFAVEFVREPDSQLAEFTAMTGLHMGQWLCVPMILGGLYLFFSAPKRQTA